MSAREEGGPAPVVRVLVVAAVLLIAVIVAILLFGGGGGYRVTADFVNAGQLVKGSEVRVAGVAVGTVENIDVSQEGTAEITFSVNGDYAPLRSGTRAIIRPTSLSGIANRYVDLQLGPQSGAEIEDGGHIGTDQTETAVELDEVFNLFDEDTRGSLQDVIKGQAVTVRGRGRQLRRGIHYLNPALSTGARLFQELTRDNRLLKRFLVDSGTLVHTLASRRDDLTGVVRNLNAHLRRAGQPAGGPGGLDRAPPPVPAARRHDLREPARRARRRRPARRRGQAGGGPARPVPEPGAGVRRRRQADGPRPLAHDQPARARTTT